ncbi:MAG: hypothetical protein GY830_10245 [Bacteroidetes bacterium]|nr:hypothetical protein [Bacteroidota bacterium]
MTQSYNFFIILNIIIIFNSCSSIDYKRNINKDLEQNLHFHQAINKEISKEDKFRLARKYSKEGNYEKSLKIFEELIEKGSVRSIYNKACIYRDIKGSKNTLNVHLIYLKKQQ